MIRTDLEGLIPPHDKACLLVLLVLQQSNIASAALLPLLGVALKSEQLGAHLEDLLLQLLVCLGLDFLGKTDDWLVVTVFFGLASTFLLSSNSASLAFRS